MFRATMCPSSGADDCVMLWPCVGMCRGCREGCQVWLARSASMDGLPANRTWQPSRSHGTYQHETRTSHSRQLLMMGTWLPETCWATIRREIKDTKSDIQLGFSYPHWITMHGKPHTRFIKFWVVTLLSQMSDITKIFVEIIIQPQIIALLGESEQCAVFSPVQCLQAWTSQFRESAFVCVLSFSASWKILEMTTAANVITTRSSVQHIKYIDL